MRTLWLIAWRNLWRNKRRTATLVAAITVGLWGVLASMAYVNAWLDDTVKNAVSTNTGHVQVQAPGYFDNPQVRRNLPEDKDLIARLAALPETRGVCDRVRGQVLLGNAERAEMGMAVGTDPAREPSVSMIPGSMVEGRWLEAGEKNGIVVGKEFIRRFKTKIGRRVILRGNNAQGDVADAAFRIVGVYETPMATFDRGTVYITLADAQSFFGLSGRVTEYVLTTDSPHHSAALKSAVAGVAPTDFVVTAWQDQLPLVVQLIQYSGGVMWYFYAFFFVAMAFGIANSFLMVVHERTRELGVMLALGVRRVTITGILLIESFLLAIVGSLAGNGLGMLAVRYLHTNGLDLSAWGEGMNYFGMSPIVYPFLTGHDIFAATAATAFTAVLMTLYPSWKAGRLQPIAALRSI